MKFECPFCKCRCESGTDIFNEIVQCPQCGKDFIPQTYLPEPPEQKVLTATNTTPDTPNHKQTLTGNGFRKNTSPKSKLIQCPTCGNEVSSNAPSCPHCGEIINEKMIPYTGAINLKDPVHLIGVIISFLVVLVVLSAIVVRIRNL